MAYRHSPDTVLIPSLAVMFFRWVSTVLMLMCSLSAISLLISPFAMQRRMSVSRGVSSSLVRDSWLFFPI